MFGSVSQGSNVQDGVTTDSVSLSYIPHGDTFYPVATIRTGDGTVLRSNDDPTRVDVSLPSGRIVQVNPASDDWQAAVAAHYTAEDWRIAEEEAFKWYGEELFIQQYGSYPIGDEVPYDAESRPLGDYSYWETLIYELGGRIGTSVSDFGLSGQTSGEYLQHPRDNRAIHNVDTADVLDDSVKGPRQYTLMALLGYTDYPSAIAAGDDDPLSWGYWVYYTLTPSALEDFSLGAFADGVETPASSLPTSGTASYSGYTSGLAIRGGTPTRDNLEDDAYWDSRSFDFLGQVSLQADFVAASVQGGVTNFQAANLYEPELLDGEVLGENGFLKNLAIDLGTASITSGTFTGDARATSGLAGAAGKWGGQFFGTPDNAGDVPPAAGGTWGVTQGTGDDDWKILGGFGAWKP